MDQTLYERYRLFWLAVGVYLLYRVGAPLVTFLGDGFLQVALSTLVFMALATWVVLRAAALPLRPVVALAWTAVLLVLFIAVRLSPAFVPALRQSPVAVETVLGISDTLMVLAASMLGLAVSHIIREPNILAPAALFAALADFAVVSLWIPRVMEVAPQALSTVAVHVPQVGAKPTPTGLRPIGIIGPADFVFLAFYFACVWFWHGGASHLHLDGHCAGGIYVLPERGGFAHTAFYGCGGHAAWSGANGGSVARCEPQVFPLLARGETRDGGGGTAGGGHHRLCFLGIARVTGDETVCLRELNIISP